MALSGVVTGSPTNKAHLKINWSATQNIGANYSTVTAIVYLVEPYNVAFGATKTGSVTINGNRKNFSTSKRFAGPGTWELTRHVVNVGHNSDGTKTFSFSANYNIAITYGGSWLSSISASGNGALNTIPRASTIGTITGGAIGSAMTININRASGGFTHRVYYTGPNRSQVEVSGNATTSASYTIPVSDANYLKNATSGTGKIRVDTLSGGKIIGTVYKNVTITVPNTATFNPTVNAPSVSVYGSGRDSAIGKYIQGISKMAISSSGSTKYGATISASSIEVTRASDGKDRMSYSGLTATSAIVTGTGNYTIQAWVKDSRGRQVRATTTIAVTAYSPPKITSFSARRKASAAQVELITKATHTIIGTSNPVSLKIERIPRTGATTVVVDVPTTQTHLNNTSTSTGNSEAISYEFMATVTDSFGKKATAIVPVSTSKVSISIHKDIGVGLGKVWERGAIDAGGEVYFNGIRFDSSDRFDATLNANDSLDFWHSLKQGTYYIAPGYITNQPSDYGLLEITRSGGYEFNAVWYSQPSGNIYRKSGNKTINNKWGLVTVDRQFNSLGAWSEFSDGTLIANLSVTYDRTESTEYYILPTLFGTIYAGIITASGDTWTNAEDTAKLGTAMSTPSNSIRVARNGNIAWRGTGSMGIYVTVIGRR